MAYKPHHYLPLMVFGLFAAPLCITNLLGIGTLFSYELASMIAMFSGMLLVIGIFQHWRHS
ncbi:hypothetical protein GF374_02850 [Candidatus Woesearchaeota archaeon]|nr:hypothetical protein [Candidatus Woesearchaeota archaeon]